MRRTIILLTLTLFALTGCKAKELADKAAIAEDLKDRGTTELLQQVADDQYTAPEDGKLTEAQIQMYLKVREHEKKIAQVAKAEMKKHADEAKETGEKSLAGMVAGFKALGSAADLMTADIRAAKDLGFNTQEYTWVKGQILAASTADMAQQINKAMSANFDKAYADAKKAYETATDDATRKMYAEMLAGYEKTRNEMTQQAEEDPATAFNRQLLAKFDEPLKAIATELAKFEDNSGDAERNVEEFKKNVDETASGQ